MPPGGITLGLPLLMAPLVWATGAQSWQDILPFAVPVNAFVLYGLAILLLAEIARQLTGSRLVALTTAGGWTFLPYLLYAIEPRGSAPGIDIRYTSMTHLMGVAVSPNQPALFLILLTLWLVLQIRDAQGIRLPVLLGASWGLATLIRPENALLAFPVGITLFLSSRGSQLFLAALVSFTLFLPQLLYNWYWFGSPVVFGYSRLAWNETYGGAMFSLSHLFSFLSLVLSRAGLAIVPLLALLIVGAYALWRIKPRGLSFLAAWILPYCLFFGTFLMTKWAPAVRLQPVIPGILILASAGLVLFSNHIRVDGPTFRRDRMANPLLPS